MPAEKNARCALIDFADTQNVQDVAVVVGVVVVVVAFDWSGWK